MLHLVESDKKNQISLSPSPITHFSFDKGRMTPLTCAKCNQQLSSNQIHNNCWLDSTHVNGIIPPWLLLVSNGSVLLRPGFLVASRTLSSSLSLSHTTHTLRAGPHRWYDIACSMTLPAMWEGMKSQQLAGAGEPITCSSPSTESVEDAVVSNCRLQGFPPLISSSLEEVTALSEREREREKRAHTHQRFEDNQSRRS